MLNKLSIRKKKHHVIVQGTAQLMGTLVLRLHLIIITASGEKKPRHLDGGRWLAGSGIIARRQKWMVVGSGAQHNPASRTHLFWWKPTPYGSNCARRAIQSGTCLCCDI